MDKELLVKYIEGNADGPQKELVAEWIDADEKNMREFMAMRGTYEAMLWNDRIGAASGSQGRKPSGRWGRWSGHP